jgi:hypothetical protein
MRYLLLISIHQTYFIMKNGDTVSWNQEKSAAEEKMVKEHQKPVTKTPKA